MAAESRAERIDKSRPTRLLIRPKDAKRQKMAARTKKFALAGMDFQYFACSSHRSFQVLK